jgi:hypothetical protein
MSATEVMPFESRVFCAISSAWSRSRGSGGGTAFCTRSEAASMKIPEGCRPAISIRPPGGDLLAAVTPASFIAMLFAQPAWPSTRSSQTGRPGTTASRSAAVGKRPRAPFFLVPAAADDPARRRIGRGISGDLGLGFLKAPRLAEIELHGLEAEPHHMAVRVDEAGDQGPAAAIDAVIGSYPGLVPGLEELPDPAVIADQNGGEANDLLVLADRIAVDVVDQGVGRGRLYAEQGRQSGQKLLHSCNLLISAEVS